MLLFTAFVVLITVIILRRSRVVDTRDSGGVGSMLGLG